MRQYKCSVCGYIYDESAGIPGKGIAPGTKWAELPDDFTCPICKAPKSVFMPLEEPSSASPPVSEVAVEPIESLRELSAGEISAICSSLAKGCEKQRLMAEMEAFTQIADYFKSRAASEKGKTLEDAAGALRSDMSKDFPAAKAAAEANADRGALRSLVWSEKVSMMMKSLMDRFAAEGDAMLKNTNVFVCDICGFIYIGDTQPEICPVCKVPAFRIRQVERRKNYASI